MSRSMAHPYWDIEQLDQGRLSLKIEDRRMYLSTSCVGRVLLGLTRDWCPDQGAGVVQQPRLLWFPVHQEVMCCIKARELYTPPGVPSHSLTWSGSQTGTKTGDSSLSEMSKSVQSNMVDKSFWANKTVEDHLDHYSYEWQQFFEVNENKQHNPTYIALQQSRILDYAVDSPVHVDGELVAGITRLPVEGTIVDLKEEAKGVNKDWVIQKLYLGCDKADVWSKSNDFHINRIVGDGAKWAAHIIAK
eukprot:Gb_03896 [translate_table: standard]